MSQFREDVNKYLITFQNGDLSRFEEFYNKYHDRLLSYAVYYLVNKNNREDVISETYIRICKYINSFKPSEDGYDWILKIIQNICRTLNKKELKHKTVDIDNIYLANEHDDYSDVEMEMLLNKLLKQNDYRNYVIAMLICTGRNQEEIATMLGISRSAVNQRISKFREIIKNNYENC